MSGSANILFCEKESLQLSIFHVLVEMHRGFDEEVVYIYISANL